MALHAEHADRMNPIDRNLVRWLNHLSQHQPVRALAVVAAKYLAVAPPLLLVALFLVALWRRDVPAVAKGGLAGVGAGLALAANQFVGHLVDRTRPYNALASVHAIGARSTDSSFYSDHTTLAVGTALGVFLLSRRLGIAALAMAVVVAVGRVSLGAHYPSDVVAAGVAASVAVGGLLVLRPPVERVLEALFRKLAAPPSA